MMDKEKTDVEIDHWCVVCDRQIVPAYRLVQPDPVPPVDDATISLTKPITNIINAITAFTTAEPQTQAKTKSKPKLSLAGGPPKALKSTTNNTTENASTPTTPTLHNVTLPPALPKKRGSVVGAGNKGGHRPGLHRSRTATGYGYATLAANAAAATKRKSTQATQALPSPNREAPPTDEVEHHERQEPLMNGGITASPLEHESMANVANLNAVDETSPSGRKARGSGDGTSTAPPLRRGYSERQLPKDGENQLAPFEKLPRKVNLPPMEGDPPAPPHNTVQDGPEILKSKAQSKLKVGKSKQPRSPLSPRYSTKPSSSIVHESTQTITPTARPQEVYEDPGKRLYCSEECRTADIMEKQRKAKTAADSQLPRTDSSLSLNNMLYDMPWLESRMYNFTRIHSGTAFSSRAPTRPASSTSLFNGLDDERFTTVRTPPIGAMWSYEKEEAERKKKRFSQPLPSRMGSSTNLNMSTTNYGYDYTPDTPSKPWNRFDAYRSLPVSPGHGTRPLLDLGDDEDDQVEAQKEQLPQLQFRRIPGAYSSVHRVDHPIPRTRSQLSAGSPTSPRHDRHRKQRNRRSLMSQFEHLGNEYFPEGEFGVRGRDKGIGEDQDWPTFLAAADRDPTLNFEDWKEYRQKKRMELAAQEELKKARQPTDEEEELNKKWQKMPYLIRATSQPTIHHAQPPQVQETRTRFRRAPSKSSSRSRGGDIQLGTSVRTTSSISSPLEMRKNLPLPSSPSGPFVPSRSAHTPGTSSTSPSDKAKAPNFAGPTYTPSPVPEPASSSHLATVSSSTPTSPNDPSASNVAGAASHTHGSASPSISERRRAKNPAIPLFTDNLPSTMAGTTGSANGNGNGTGAGAGTGTTAANNPNRLSLTGLPPMRSPLGLYSVNAEEAAAAAKDEGEKESKEKSPTKVSSNSVPLRESSILAGNLRALQPLVIKANIAVKCPPTSTTSGDQKVGPPTLTNLTVQTDQTVRHGADEKSAIESGSSPTLITAISGSGSSGHSSMSRSAEARHELQKLGRFYSTLPPDSERQVQLTIDLNSAMPTPSSTLPVRDSQNKSIHDFAFPTPAQASLSKAYLDHLGSVPETSLLGRWKLTLGGWDGQVQTQAQTQTQADTQGEKRRSLWGIFGSVRQ